VIFEYCHVFRSGGSLMLNQEQKTKFNEYLMPLVHSKFDELKGQERKMDEDIQ
jgi:hypothetical protein